MFTGLVETFGSVTSVRKTGNSIRLAVKPLSEFDVKLGDSICVNGICLTVTELTGNISFDVSPETMRSTNFRELKTGCKVNLERALRLSDRLGGHIVTGHVDGTGTIIDKKRAGEYTFYSFESTPEILKYIVEKGSVAIDGISLTVAALEKGYFRVAIIPHTLSATNIGGKGIGDKVNLEVDIIGKYIERFISRKNIGSGLSKLLKEEGFTNG